MSHKGKHQIDIVLVYPFLEEANWKNELRSKDNLALGYLAACLRKKGFLVDILHAEYFKLNLEEVVKSLVEMNPTAVGFSCTAQRAYPVVKEYSKRIKHYLKAPIIVGGGFPTTAHVEILKDCPEIDVVCRGEGEELIVEFMKVINNSNLWAKVEGLSFRDERGHVIVNPERKVNEHLDNLPFPEKDWLVHMHREIDAGLYYININAGRGCYGHCSFCSMKKIFTGDRRVRSPGNVVQEIGKYIEKYNTRYFRFIDEVFIVANNKNWIFSFCNEVGEKKLKFYFHIEARVDGIERDVIEALYSVGLREIFIGFESGSNRILRRYRKGHNMANASQALSILNDYPIKVQLGFIMLDPLMSFEELGENIRWIINTRKYSKHNLYNKLNVYYGTEIYHQLYAKGLLIPGQFYERQGYKFIDKRVEKFAKMIEWAKQSFKEFNIAVNSLIKSMVHSRQISRYWKKAFDEIEKVEIQVWTDMVETLFFWVNEEKTEEKVYQYIDKKLQTCINNINKFFTKSDNQNEGINGLLLRDTHSLLVP